MSQKKGKPNQAFNLKKLSQSCAKNWDTVFFLESSKKTQVYVSRNERRNKIMSSYENGRTLKFTESVKMESQQFWWITKEKKSCINKPGNIHFNTYDERKPS